VVWVLSMVVLLQIDGWACNQWRGWGVTTAASEHDVGQCWCPVAALHFSLLFGTSCFQPAAVQQL
jgi:hypothetical protein